MKLFKQALLVSVVMTLPVMAMATNLVPLAGGTGLLGTAHDFASFTGDSANYSITAASGVGNTGANRVGLCTYCHTPHSAQSTLLLWNHKMTSTASFKWDEATTTGGTPYATLTPAYKGPSIKCLSCHDGSVAIGDVSIYQDVPNATLNSFKVGGLAGGSALVERIIGGGGAMKGNHPVGMAYPLNNVAGTYNSTTTGPNVTLTEFQGNPVATSTTSLTHIKLYNDTTGGGNIVGGAVAGTSGIECSTCHDPHNKASTDDLFLRAGLAGSAATDGYICLQCHIK